MFVNCTDPKNGEKVEGGEARDEAKIFWEESDGHFSCLHVLSGWEYGNDGAVNRQMEERE